MSKQQVAERPKAPDLAEAVALVEKLAADYALGELSKKGRMERAVILARGMQELRQAIEPILPSILPLMNSRLGFLTDKDPRKPGKGGERPQPYSAEVVRDCLIEALLRGLYPVNNEFNIIAAGCYVTKDGYERLTRELPGVTDLDVRPAVPRAGEGGAVVHVGASWKLNGRKMELLDDQGKPGRSFAVRLNAGMGADAAVGKALRKTYAAIYRQITGTTHSDGEVGELDAPVMGRASELPAPTKADAVASRLGVPRGNGHGERPDLDALHALIKAAKLSLDDVVALVANYGHDRLEQLTADQVRELGAELEDRLRQQQEEAAERAALADG